MALRLLLGSDAHTDDTHDVIHSSSCGIDAYSALGEMSGHVDHGDDHGDGHEEGHGDEAFNHIYFVMLFIAALWFAGKAAVKLKMPALVGEIVFGIILGPHLVNLPGDHGSDFLIVIGEIGLVMLVVEAGIDVDVGLLQLIGPPALGVAVMGSIFPMSLGFGISYLFMGTDIGTSIAVGACFAPTSMGIALNVLKKAKILNTPTGQLIIAAAILDDVIALIILSELGAMKDPTAMKIAMPLIVSPVLILLFGYLAIRWIPKWIAVLMKYISKENQENAILALLFVATFVMVPVCHFLGSSHLLGAFLAGLMFCTDHTIHHVWQTQIKRVLQGILRVFFASTIGFAIPIRDFTQATIIIRGIVYCIAGVGKVVTGFFATPLTKKEFFTVGFSMSAWGEFAFILATASFAEGALDQESFSSVLLAVLLSVIISPYALSFNLAYYAKKDKQKITQQLKEFDGTNLHPVYFSINTKSQGSWGHQNKVLQKIFNLKLEIIDFRSWHAPEFNYSHDQPLTKESFYVQDLLLALPPTKHLDDEEREDLQLRVKQIRTELKKIMSAKAVVSIKRWLPGMSKKDDQLEPTDDYMKSMFGGNIEFKPKKLKSVEYCRREAFKQAHSLMSLFDAKQTMSEIKRMSSRHLAGLQQKSGVSRNSAWESRDHSLTFSEEDGGKKHRKTQSFDGANGTGAKPKLHGSNSNPTKPHGARSPRDHGMAGFEDTGAGGAGAVPVTNKEINPLSHWMDESPVHKGKNGEELSYIYGDEDSQLHNLPEYSVDNMPEYALQMFNPTLPQLDEDGANNHKMKLQQLMAKDERDGMETSEPEETDDEKDKNIVDVANSVPIASAPPAVLEDGEEQQDENVTVDTDKLKKKLTIKIYPPAMEPVASHSPVGDDGSPPKTYLD